MNFNAPPPPEPLRAKLYQNTCAFNPHTMYRDTFTSPMRNEHEVNPPTRKAHESSIPMLSNTAKF